jgi:hypothetical protein
MQKGGLTLDDFPKEAVKLLKTFTYITLPKVWYKKGIFFSKCFGKKFDLNRIKCLRKEK